MSTSSPRISHDAEADSDGRRDLFAQRFVEAEAGLYGFLYSLQPNCSEADDVMQEAMVTLWQRFDEYDESRPFYRWACSFIYHKILEYRRRRDKQAAQLSNEALELLHVEQAQTCVPSGEERRNVLAACLSAMSEADRELIAIRYGNNHGALDSFAQKTGATPNSLYKRMQRIRTGLAKCMKASLYRDQWA